MRVAPYLLWQRVCTKEPVGSLLIHVSEPSVSEADTGPMKCPGRRDVIGIALGAAAALFAPPARADRDHDRARLAVARGEALPLSDILARVRPELGGEVIGVSFERKSDRWVYEFRVIAPAGRLMEVYVDAATAKIIKREDH
jgi:hypothetical protein